MSGVQVFIAVAAAIVLFLFGIEHFSREVQAVAGEKFRRTLERSTRNPVMGFLLGAAVTAVIQSSTATSVIAVGLANAGVITFRQSLGVLFGANVGTTVTSQLVALNITDFAPVLILTGFAAGLLPFKWRILGRSIFYFGLVFFSLNLVSSSAAPLKDHPEVIRFLASVEGPLVGVLVGAGFTALVQSSSVATGLAIVLIGQGLLSFDVALPLVLGANVGTTVTALLASARLDTSARRTAVSHALYNVGGVLLFLPFLGPFQAVLETLNPDPVTRLALAHLLFNGATACVFLIALNPFARLIERLIPDEEGDVDPVRAPRIESLPADPAAVREALRAWVTDLLRHQQLAYTASVMALETRDTKIENRAERASSMVQYSLQEGAELVSQLARGKVSAAGSSLILEVVMALDHVRQLQDSIGDLLTLSGHLRRHNARFSLDAILEMQRVYPQAAKLLETLTRVAEGEVADEELKARDRELTQTLEETYRQFLVLVTREEEGSELADFLSIHQRLRSKAKTFAALLSRGELVGRAETAEAGQARADVAEAEAAAGPAAAPGDETGGASTAR